MPKFPLRRDVILCDPEGRWTGLLKSELAGDGIHWIVCSKFQSLREIDWPRRLAFDRTRDRQVELVVAVTQSSDLIPLAEVLRSMSDGPAPPLAVVLTEDQIESTESCRRMGAGAIYQGLTDLPRLVQAIRGLLAVPAWSELELEQSIENGLPWGTPNDPEMA